jgi:hypothetical protein
MGKIASLSSFYSVHGASRRAQLGTEGNEDNRELSKFDFPL